MTDIEYTYSHAAILVSNIERSATFYERVLGWRLEFAREFDESLGKANGYGGPGRIMMGQIGGVHLQLVEMRVPLVHKQRQNHFGLFMCSAIVRDLAPVRERLKADGVPITRELDVGKSHLIVMTDPDGQEVGIIGPQT
jgi:catechol 2,3-dioxygenase-like lactoylglutathione lyase family enzyme